MSVLEADIRRWDIGQTLLRHGNHGCLRLKLAAYARLTMIVLYTFKCQPSRWKPTFNRFVSVIASVVGVDLSDPTTNAWIQSHW